MTILMCLKNYDKIENQKKNTDVPGLFDKPSLFTKNKLKKTPI